MAKKDFRPLAREIVQNIGGKDNISYLAHCMTRLRFSVKDLSAVDTEKMGKVKGVLGVQRVGEQIQVVIGNDVPEVYATVCDEYGFDKQKSLDENVDINLPKGKRTIGSVFGGIVSAIAGCVAPIIPVMIGSSLITLVITLLTNYASVDPTTNTIQVLTFVANAAFYFMPIYIGSTAAKKFNTNSGLGMLMGAILIHPTYTAAVAEQASLSVFGLPITMSSYTNTVLPVILIVFVMSYVERLWSRVIPKMVRSFLLPLATLLVMVPIAFCVLGPLGSLLSGYIMAFFTAVHNFTGFIGVGVVAAFYSVMVMTGTHVGMTPIMVQSFADYGYESLFYPAGCVANCNQGAAALAVAVKTKNKELKAEAFTASIPALLGRVTEPALYGINLKYKKPFYSAMIGSFFGGCFAGLVGTKVYFFGGGGLLAFAGYIGPDGGGSELLLALAGLGIGAVVTFVITLFLFSDKDVSAATE